LDEKIQSNFLDRLVTRIEGHERHSKNRWIALSLSRVKVLVVGIREKLLYLFVQKLTTGHRDLLCSVTSLIVKSQLEWPPYRRGVMHFLCSSAVMSLRRAYKWWN